MHECNEKIVLNLFYWPSNNSLLTMIVVFSFIYSKVAIKKLLKKVTIQRRNFYNELIKEMLESTLTSLKRIVSAQARML